MMPFHCANFLRRLSFQTSSRRLRGKIATRYQGRHRRGAIVVFSAILMVVMFGFVAFALDLGYLCLVRTELQRTADASALAGVSKLYPLSDTIEMNTFYLAPDITGARGEAQTFARYNGGGQYHGSRSMRTDVLKLDSNEWNGTDGDIIIGRFHDASIRSEQLIPTEIFPNTVQVQARLDDAHSNGSVALFFARVLGFEDANVRVSAAATLIHASLLPFATSMDKWASLESGGDGDTFTYAHGVIPGQGDGISEITIYPDVKWDGQDLPPGNFGALSIGTNTASAADLRRQIDQGPTPDELAFHGSLSEGVVMSGKTGLNATTKVAFNGGWDTSDLRYYAGIIGHPRFLPIYEAVSGNGTNSQFSITKFCAVRVVDVNLKGKNKWITLQPIQNRKNLMTVRLTR